MSPKIKLIILSLILLTAFFYPQQYPGNNAAFGQKILNKSSSKSKKFTNLIYEETFEGPSFFPLSGKGSDKVHSIENCNLDWTLSVVTQPVFRGKKACRFEIRKNQPLVGISKRIRSEVVIIKADDDDRFTSEMWYSFAVLFPTVGFEYDDKRDCINQWFEDGSRETTLRVEKDKAYLEVTPALGSATMMKYDLFSMNRGMKGDITSFISIPKNRWHEFVFHFIHSKKENGLIEVWRDGIKIHHINGPNIHLKLPKWKIGLYKTSFQDNPSKPDKVSALNSRVIYFDNIRVGKASASLPDMSSPDFLPSPNIIDPSSDK
jgi:Polysaccharide lyase